ncbi:MAG: substrate-binding domain-containing protein [Burkholderiaceae bacterium]|nr:substrate-binding domain-containing protein [Microbacteriaceae bacterium]
MSASTAPTARMVGMSLVRATEIMGAEPYFHDFSAGLESVLRPHGFAVLTRVLPTVEEEIATFRRWKAGGDVGAIVLVDLSHDDPRLPVLRELELPVVVVGNPAIAAEFPAVWTNDDGAMRDAVAFLLSLGHRRLAHVSGPLRMAHTLSRAHAFAAECAAAGAASSTLAGDYSQGSGSRATADLLSRTDRPTAIIFDNDLMALGGLEAADVADVAVPAHLSLLAWDDSAQCQLSTPPLSAVSHDVQAIGRLTGDTLLAVFDGSALKAVEAPRVSIVSRGTTSNHKLFI